MDALPESTLNMIIGGIFGLASTIINVVFNGIILLMMRQEESRLKERLDRIERNRERLEKLQEERQKGKSS